MVRNILFYFVTNFEDYAAGLTTGAPNFLMQQELTMKLRRLSACAALLCGAFVVSAQTAELFKPYRTTELRLPSVPIVVADPYFSVWSPYDRLNEGPTTHWTGNQKPIEGLLRVDGKTYRFMGQGSTMAETIVPMADEEAWKARMARKDPGEGWQKSGFDDSAWEPAVGAIGSLGLSNVRTNWNERRGDIYVRREVTLTPADLEGELALVFSHDDAMELYINGEEVVSTGDSWKNEVELPLSAEAKSLLKPGKNLIAAHCHNSGWDGYTDFGLYRKLPTDGGKIAAAVQKSIDVMPTSTYYTFECGPVELDLVFTAPMLMDDYDLLSAPANYISFQVRSRDGKAHDVQLLLTATPEMAQNEADQPTISTLEEEKGLKYLKTGTIEQPILAKADDHICIDWGYFYLPAINGEVSLAPDSEVKASFMASGTLPESATEVLAYKPKQRPTLAYLHNFGNTEEASGFTLMGYDEILDIEYLFKRYKGYWAHGGEVSITDMLRRMASGYAQTMKRCRELDKTLYDDAFAIGGQKYADLLSASYRQAIGAHKLFQDDKGTLLFFSKENDSNGCVNTVDLTYPEAPLFLTYNPELQKAMMNSILDYCNSGRWTKPYAPHDLGTYPIANGQGYGSNMPLEEAGNMLILTAQCCMLDGNTLYADPYWPILTTWADYLAENGQDPENQLCTDDFAGHWAHNANLAVKAIMGVAAYARLADLRGDAATAAKYRARAKEMASRWEKDAREGSGKHLHYKLAYDREGTWSQKYNMVWDKLWGSALFPDQVAKAETDYYLTRQNRYGLPLDSRKDYSKSDWIMWSAAMAPDAGTMSLFVEPLYNYVNETPTRVPISDWFDTKTGKKTGFMARSVVAGHWMPVFARKLGKMKIN